MILTSVLKQTLILAVWCFWSTQHRWTEETILFFLRDSLPTQLLLLPATGGRAQLQEWKVSRESGANMWSMVTHRIAFFAWSSQTKLKWLYSWSSTKNYSPSLPHKVTSGLWHKADEGILHVLLLLKQKWLIAYIINPLCMRGCVAFFIYKLRVLIMI